MEVVRLRLNKLGGDRKPVTQLTVPHSMARELHKEGVTHLVMEWQSDGSIRMTPIKPHGQQ